MSIVHPSWHCPETDRQPASEHCQTCGNFPHCDDARAMYAEFLLSTAFSIRHLSTRNTTVATACDATNVARVQGVGNSYSEARTELSKSLVETLERERRNGNGKKDEVLFQMTIRQEAGLTKERGE